VVVPDEDAAEQHVEASAERSGVDAAWVTALRGGNGVAPVVAAASLGLVHAPQFLAPQ
jgi:hypothetical protein